MSSFYIRHKLKARGNKKGKLGRVKLTQDASESTDICWSMKMFSWLRRKCSCVLLGSRLSMDGENRKVIGSQRVSLNMQPYLVCLFTWLAGLVSEGHERGERERPAGQKEVHCWVYWRQTTAENIVLRYSHWKRGYVFVWVCKVRKKEWKN